MARGIRQKTHMFKFADAGQRGKELKTVEGRNMIPIYTQENRRTKRQGKPSYIYWHEGTSHVYYNHKRNPRTRAYFLPFGFDDTEMERLYKIFVEPPLTPPEQAWLAQNDFRKA